MNIIINRQYCILKYRIMYVSENIMNILKFKKKEIISSLNNINFNDSYLNIKTIEKNFISFSKIELTSILNLYSKQVSRGIWKDYALDSQFDNAVFSVYKHTQDKPIYQIIKNSQKRFRNKPIFFIKKDGEIISKSNDLFIILSNFEKKLSIKKLKKH